MTYWSNLLPRKIAASEQPGKLKEATDSASGPKSGQGRVDSPQPIKISKEDLMRVLGNPKVDKPNTGGDGISFNHWLWASKSKARATEADSSGSLVQMTRAGVKEGGPGSGRHKVMGSAPSQEQLLKLAQQKFYSPNIKFVPTSDNKWDVHNANGKIDGLHVDVKGGRYRLNRKIESNKESNQKSHMGSFRLIEGAAEKIDKQIEESRYKVVLIQEGLGNFRDAYFYAKSALQYAAENQVFEGKKMFINHPSTIDEQTRPERDVKDIGGHFENVAYQETSEGRGQLIGDLCVLPGQQYDWIRSLFNHDIDFKEKNPGKEFVGLSINANGAAEPKGLTEFIKETKLPESVLAKLNEAMEKGIDTIKVVSAITDSESCDLVTSAGAGGKILQLL